MSRLPVLINCSVPPPDTPTTCQVDGRDDRSVRGDDCSVSPLRRSGAANFRRFGWVWRQKAFFVVKPP